MCLDASSLLRGLTRSTSSAAEILRKVLRGSAILVVSDGIEDEYRGLILRRSVRRHLERRRISSQDLLNQIADLPVLAERVEPEGEAPPCRDEDDRKYLHCAVWAGVDLLVTSDADLLALGDVEALQS